LDFVHPWQLSPESRFPDLHEQGPDFLGDYARRPLHPGYAICQCSRKRIEEAFGWAKMVAGSCDNGLGELVQTKARG
jgi:hypothetical protein